jgi:hypothetical protein
MPIRLTPIARMAMTRAGSSSGWGDDGRPATTDEANRQNHPRDRRAKPSGEMQRRAVAYRRHHGIGKRGVVGPAAARLREDDPRLPYDGAFPREADANRDLIVIVRRTPAGGEPCRDAMDAVYRRLRLGGLLSRPDGQRDDPDRGKAPNRPTSLHSAFAARPQRYYCGRHGRYNVRRPLYGALLSLGPAWR